MSRSKPQTGDCHQPEAPERDLLVGVSWHRPARVLYLIPSLGGGGAERLLNVLMRTIDPAVAQPLLVVLKDAAGPFAQTLPAGTRVMSLKKRRKADLMSLVWRLARLFEDERPEVAVGFMTYANVLLLAARHVSAWKPSIIVTEHNNPAHSATTVTQGIRDWAGRRLYPGASRLVGVSAQLSDALRASHPTLGARIVAIPNPYDPILDESDVDDLSTSPDTTAAESWLRGNVPVILAVGRLAPEKGHAYLLKALALLRDHRDVRVVVAGEGPERSALESLAHDLGIEDSVALPGFVSNPFPWMRAATVVAHPSLSEGFGLTLAEAARCGAVIVAADCDYGPREILEDGVSGLLVPPGDPESLATTLDRVLDDPALAGRLRQGALLRSQEFSPRRIADQYESLICSVAAERSRMKSP